MNGGGGPREDLSGYLHRAFDNARETGFFSSKRVKIQHFGFRGSVFGSFLVTLPKFMNVHLWVRRNSSKKKFNSLNCNLISIFKFATSKKIT